MKKVLLIIYLSVTCTFVHAQSKQFDKFNFLLGNWSGEGTGFGNSKSKIESGFQLVLGDKYIEVTNESKFAPTDKNPEGEYHIDKGLISYDRSRKLIVFRQFHIEGFVNQYILVDSLSTASKLVFESEIIENFMPGGKARWTIIKHSENEIETVFDLSMNLNGYTCYGINKLIRKK